MIHQRLELIYQHKNNVMLQEITVRVLNFVGKIFVFGWQENSWDINFHGHGGVVGTIVI